MTILRRLFTPLGGVAALLVCWLPWVRLECGDTRTDPNLWQLADQEWKLYAFPVLAALIIVFGLVYVYAKRREWAAGALVASFLAFAAWVYLLFEHRDVALKQAEAQMMGGQFSEWMKELKITLMPGFYIFGVMALLSALFQLPNILPPRKDRDKKAPV